MQGIWCLWPRSPRDREPFLGRTLGEYLILRDLEKFESQKSGGMPAAFDVTMLSRNHFASSAHRISRNCPEEGAVQGILAKSKHSSFHQIAAAMAVIFRSSALIAP